MFARLRCMRALPLHALRCATTMSAAATPVSRRVKPLPSIEDAKLMPRHVSDLTGDQLVLLSERGEHLDASRERLRREIMRIDRIAYSETTPIVSPISRQPPCLLFYRARRTCTNCARCEPGQLLGIAKACVDNQMLMKAPYQLSIYTALVAGWASLPLVFHYTTASIFNDYFVTAEPPDVGEADTWLEVGAWSWSWMEPPLGTISFFLLCIQFARDQRMSIGGLSMVEQMQEKQIAMIARQVRGLRLDRVGLRRITSDHD